MACDLYCFCIVEGYPRIALAAGQNRFNVEAPVLWVRTGNFGSVLNSSNALKNLLGRLLWTALTSFSKCSANRSSWYLGFFLKTFLTIMRCSRKRRFTSNICFPMAELSNCFEFFKRQITSMRCAPKCKKPTSKFVLQFLPQTAFGTGVSSFAVSSQTHRWRNRGFRMCLGLHFFLGESGLHFWISTFVRWCNFTCLRVQKFSWHTAEKLL